jgi:hypothetical protein
MGVPHVNKKSRPPWAAAALSRCWWQHAWARTKEMFGSNQKTLWLGRLWAKLLGEYVLTFTRSAG